MPLRLHMHCVYREVIDTAPLVSFNGISYFFLLSTILLIRKYLLQEDNEQKNKPFENALRINLSALFERISKAMILCELESLTPWTGQTPTQFLLALRCLIWAQSSPSISGLLTTELGGRKQWGSRTLWVSSRAPRKSGDLINFEQVIDL